MSAGARQRPACPSCGSAAGFAVVESFTHRSVVAPGEAPGKPPTLTLFLTPEGVRTVSCVGCGVSLSPGMLEATGLLLTRV